MALTKPCGSWRIKIEKKVLKNSTMAFLKGRKVFFSAIFRGISLVLSEGYSKKSEKLKQLEQPNSFP